MKRVYSVDQWQRDFAAAFGQSIPLEAMNTKARGALLAADNDEPEPKLCRCGIEDCHPECPHRARSAE